MALDLQPTLRGTLVWLRPLRPEDFGALFAVAADPLLWEQHPEPDRYQEVVFRGFFAAALGSGGALVVIDSQSGRVIGSSRYHGLDEERSEVEIGWTFLARTHWGGRYNRELKRLMLEHAFATVQNVIFRIGPGNLRSRRSIERIGAQLVATPADGLRRSVTYRIRRSDWLPGASGTDSPQPT